MNIGNKIRELRVSEGMTQRQLAHKLWISQSAIAGYETNLRFPDAQMLGKMADLFQVTVDYLLGRED